MVLNREQIYSVNPVEHNIFGEKKPFYFEPNCYYHIDYVYRQFKAQNSLEKIVQL